MELDFLASCEADDVRAWLEGHPVDSHLVNSRDCKERTPFLLAALYGKVDVMQVLVLEEYKADVLATDNYRRSALHLAAKNNRVEAVQYLLGLRADVNARDGYGRQPIHLAALKGALEVIPPLLDAGASIESEDNYHRTPLHLAAKNNHALAVEQLISLGAAVNAEDDYGREPHHLASMHGSNEALERLLNHSDVDVLSEDSFEHNALYLAIYHNKTNTEATLRNYYEVHKIYSPEIDNDVESLDS